MKFELSSWLQIEGAGPEDSGTYRCIARNTLGSVSASAVLGILGAGGTEMSPGSFYLALIIIGLNHFSFIFLEKTVNI